MFDLAHILEGARDKFIAVAFHDLETGTEYSLNANESLHPASTFKVHVMMEVLHQADQELLSLSEQLPIVNSFTSIADGSRFSLLEKDDAETSLYQRIGECESIIELTRLMIVRSSNLATNLLLERIGTKNVNNFIQALGITGVTVRRGVEDKVAFRSGLNNSGTASGLTHTMKLLAEGKVISEQASNLMIKIMLGQEFNESLPALLPKSVQVAHKTGWTGEYHHDTGIVFIEGRRPYALSIMTRGFAEDKPAEAHQCIAQISKQIYTQIQ